MKIRELIDDVPYKEEKVWPLDIEKLLNMDINIMDDWSRAESLIKNAVIAFPKAVEMRVALYKLLAYSNRLDEAHKEIQAVLEETKPGHPCIPERAAGENRIYLYTLKALAFVSLKQGNIVRAIEALDQLETLDPDDQVGGSVVRELAEGLQDG